MFKRKRQFAHEGILRETTRGGVESWRSGQSRVSGTGPTANLNSSSMAMNQARMKPADENNIGGQAAGLILRRSDSVDCGGTRTPCGFLMAPSPHGVRAPPGNGQRESGRSP